MNRPTGISRRSLLKGGLALGATAAAAGRCAYIPSDEPAVVSLPKSAKAKIDGDLYYFNWADYLDPGVLRRFQKEYGVKIIQSNFDSMEGMYAKINAGNQYDVVFPIAKWVAKMRQEGKLRAIDHAPALQRRPGLLLRLLLQPALVRREVGGLGAVHRLQDRHRLAHRQGRHHDRQLARPVEPAGHQAHLHPRRPGRGARHGRPAARLRREHHQGLAARRHQEAADQPEEVPPRLLLRRRQQHEQRRRVDPPHVERRLPLPAPGPRRSTRRTSTSRRPRRARRSTPTPTRSRPTPVTPAPRWSSSTTCCGPRT